MVKDFFKTEQWWDTGTEFIKLKEYYGLWWYNPWFTRFFYIQFPIIFALIGSILLYKKKRYFELAFSVCMFVIPFVGASISINRFLLQSFPFILVVSEESYDNKWLKYIVLFVYVAGFIMTLFLFTHGLWAG